MGLVVGSQLKTSRPRATAARCGWNVRVAYVTRARGAHVTVAPRFPRRRLALVAPPLDPFSCAAHAMPSRGAHAPHLMLTPPPSARGCMARCEKFNLQAERDRYQGLPRLAKTYGGPRQM